MRGVLFTSLWLFCGSWAAGQGPLINEVVPGGGTTADWLEVYNPGPRPVDLQGYAFVVRGHTHRIIGQFLVPAHGHEVLWCDRLPEEGPNHLDLKLPRDGGTLLLIAPDRSTVCDVFSWPALPPGVAIGRAQDGGKAWGYFGNTTPGAPNSGSAAAHRLLATPILSELSGTVHCAAAEGTTVRYTTDGSVPDSSSPVLVTPLVIAAPTIITARAFAPDALPSPATALTIPDAGISRFVAVRADPHDLFDEARGLLANNDAANFARTGKAWQREAQVEWHVGDSVALREVRVAVSGSGTRSLPKKNFKLYERSPEDSETILRADATPHAFLRNLFLECVVKQGAQMPGASSGVDVQQSTPLPLYLNGVYNGLYRAMPAKNSVWLRELSGKESVEVIDGPGAHALKGNDVQHGRMLSMLERGAPLDSLSALADLNSLLDLACFDLYTGRADHDLNVRCWRPREKGGRWRWILFDMDLWAPPHERTVDRMCSASAPEAPYLPWLLRHEELRPLLLARLSAWLATSLASDRATTLADSLFRANDALMRADHARWNSEMALPAPEESIADLRTHIAERPASLLEQLEERTGQALRKMTVRVVPSGAGEVSVMDLPLTTDERVFSAFAGALMRFSAHAAPGYEFVEWQGTEEKGGTVTVDPAKTKNLRAVFGLVTKGTL